MTDKFTGVWIPKTIVKDNILSSTEKLILSSIIGLCNNQSKTCTASNIYLGKLWGFSERRIKQVLSKLESNGFIVRGKIKPPDGNGYSRRGVKITSLIEGKVIHPNSKENKKPFIIKDKEMEEVFNDFKNYRKELGKQLVGSSEIASYEKLSSLSKENIDVARKIVQQSIGNGWSGLFELKSDKKSKITNQYKKNTYEQFIKKNRYN